MELKKSIYNPQKLESKWFKVWSEQSVYQTSQNPKKPVFVLGMFPYPSGEGLHTGHVRIFTATDVIARYLRMKGFDVLLPMGFDAFGLPAENAAIKAKKNPKEMVPKNEANFKRQMESVGLSYDWQRAFSTTDPEYYRWTQWLFLKLYEQKNDMGERLVYRKEVSINWCPFCKTGLANEEVEADGTHERCGNAIEQRLMPQWLMRITDYADPLLYDLDQYEWVDEDGEKKKGLDWPKGILEMQRNWIGRKEGVVVKFPLGSSKEISKSRYTVEVFTTRLDTIFGLTFLVVSPEMAKNWIDEGWQPSEEVVDYVNASLRKLEQQRLAEVKDKTGVNTGVVVINPVSGEEIPVFVADYVLGSVGTGVVMGVPAHDERDFSFASQHNLPIKWVIKPAKGELVHQNSYDLDGILERSGQYSGLTSMEAREKIFKSLSEQEKASKHVSYHLRDWVFSRQRYWGEPIPVVYCPKCGDENGVVPLSEKELPLVLPEMESYEPTGTGQSPLAEAKDWVETVCPKCGGPARRETDTMPNWAGSCWYFLRFADPKNNKKAWSKEALDRWLPVNWYLGGAEHAVLHLLYARFWVKVFAAIGLLDFTEPFLRLRSVGMVLASDGRKMSKSLGNVVNPDSIVEKYGADALRVYEMFMGPWNQSIAWETRSMIGCYRFLEKFWNQASRTIQQQPKSSDSKLKIKLQKLVKKCERDYLDFKFNTTVATAMEFVNDWQKSTQGLAKDDLEQLIRAIAPITPFIAEEINEALGESTLVAKKSWPEVGEVVEETKTVIVQVGGKHRATVTLASKEAQNEENVTKAARELEVVAKHLRTEPRKVIFIPGKLINFVL